MMRSLVPLAGIVLLAACGSEPVPATNNCDVLDPLFADGAFVIVTAPVPGDSVAADFEVSGCSRTFESNVVWTLRGRDGRTLASGFTTGGGVDGAAAFAFTVSYGPTVREIGTLEVSEPAATEAEGYPPLRVVLPLALAGGATE
ncbi:MAG: Gmad2 immunoglobulin-like domain-containing protein [Gammaproteobacteria bacterium]|nr:Gmad2 immunoglobulin-like domain-containing protein [Gammaproteobacteria bacterium]MDH4254493.1 Gmad2 immunoglobulin-like domain-containing protein [Gammaproteobacteria bacterium]MDH5309097.1 Gmad2 immunoglobulin-like domain-containing protein [Gammaproteobacteria bacterium]